MLSIPIYLCVGFALNPALPRQAARCSLTDTTEIQAQDAGVLNMDLSLDLGASSAVPTARDLGCQALYMGLGFRV